MENKKTGNQQEKEEKVMITKAERRIVAIIMAAMTCAVTVSTTGLAVYAEDNSTSIENIEIGKQYETTVESGKDIQKYQFTPEKTGTYHFYSTGNEDTYGYVYDANEQLIASDNDSGDDLNFSIDLNLEAGQEYYFEAGYFMDGQAGTIQWKVEPESSEIQTEETEDAEVKNATEETKEENVADSEEIAVQGGTNIENGYEYSELTDGTVEITGYTGNDKNISIPETLSGKKVTVIGKEAFFENKELNSVTIPKNVTSIQYQSFSACDNLKNISFAKGSELQKIEAAAFYSDEKLEEIICPLKLKGIGENSFGGCNSLTRVELNDGLETIGTFAFCNTGIKSIEIKDSVINLGEWAFGNCSKLQDVKLGKGISAIKDFTFEYCKKLDNVIIPDNITSIGQYAFEGCGLTKIDIPDSVTSIGLGAFEYCENLKKVTIGNGMAYVSNCAFSYTGIESVKIGNCVKTLNDYAFEESKNLKEISIPSNVTEIQYAVFSGCEALEKIDIPDSLEKIGGNSFRGTKWYANQKDGVVYAGKVLYSYKGNMPQKTSIDIKKGTKGISSFAFNSEENLENITIPEGVTNIGDYAFYNCSAMTNVSIPNSVTEIGECALGYKEVDDETQGEHYVSGRYAMLGYHAIIPGFTIYGEAGSEAEKYASQNNIAFKKNIHTVTFKDGEQIIDTQKVTSGESATAPELQKEGYVFAGWSESYSNVTSDITVTAKWIAQNGWVKNDNKWYYYENGKMKKNAWIQSNGNYYYVDESGAMLTDTWIGDYYVDANGVWLKNYRPAKWMMTNGKWWYRNVDGSYPVNCWKQISGIWYRFDNAGYMITGWSKIDNQWYYMNSSGAMQNGWQSIGNAWYYFKDNGIMATGWQKVDDNWYYLESSGAMASNKWIGNYYVESSGAMATNKWIGIYYVDNTGLWTKTKTFDQWMKSGNQWWYRHADGSYARDGWETIGGKDYLFDANGWMLTGWQKVDNNWYYLESSGMKATNKWISGKYYVKSDGVMATNEWVDNGRYYVDATGVWSSSK